MRPKNQKLLFLIPNQKFFVSHRLPIALAAIRAGYEVAVAGPEDNAVDSFLDERIKYYCVPSKRRGITFSGEIKTFLKIRNIVKTFRPDLIHLITAKQIFYGGLICRLHKIPSVVAITGLGHAFTHSNRYFKFLQFCLLCMYRAAIGSRINHIIFQNREDLNIFRSFGILNKVSSSIINGSGVDLNKIFPHPFPSGETVVVLPARMLRDKGVIEFVEAAKLLKNRSINARFQLIGDPDEGNPSSISRADISEWVEEGIVEWKPFTKDICNALGKSHLVVLPSYREGFPKTLIDAAAAGRACATTDVPGCRDAININKTGVLFKARNSLALAHAIEPLINDRNRLIQMGVNARRHALESFDINQVCDQHLAIYQMLGSKFSARSVPKYQRCHRHAA